MDRDPYAAPRRRPARVADEIRRQLGDVLLRRVSDPKVSGIAVTDVEVTADLRLARVYYTVGGDEQERAEVARGLERAAGFIKRELSGRLLLKFMPDFEFFYDESLDRGARVDALLADLARERGEDEASDEPSSGDDVEEG